MQDDNLKELSKKELKKYICEKYNLNGKIIDDISISKNGKTIFCKSYERIESISIEITINDD